jgi:hypothetical protein
MPKHWMHNSHLVGGIDNEETYAPDEFGVIGKVYNFWGAGGLLLYVIFQMTNAELAS